MIVQCTKFKKCMAFLPEYSGEYSKNWSNDPKQNPLVFVDCSCAWRTFEGGQILFCQLFVDAVLFVPRECSEFFSRRKGFEGLWRRLVSLFGRSAAVNVDVGQRVRFDGLNPLRQSRIEARKRVVDLDSRRPLH